MVVDFIFYIHARMPSASLTDGLSEEGRMYLRCEFFEKIY